MHEKLILYNKTYALRGDKMIKIEPKTPDFPEFIDFEMPFGGKLRADNRWILSSKIMPWDFIQSEYGKKFKSMKIGAPAKKGRIAFGALYIKQEMNISDEEVVQQIIENPYLQYFLGYEKYSDKKPFDSSLMVYFRRRFTAEMLDEINEKMLEIKNKQLARDDNSDNDKTPPTHKGKLIVDATCTPADIKYPTDIGVLNTAREKSEKIIDILHLAFIGEKKKPRTYRKIARKNYLSASKSKRLSNSKRRKAIRKQLGYLNRNLNSISKMLEYSDINFLEKKDYKNLLVIHEVYRQQKYMYDNRCKKVSDRIVSISQPHVRPIVRGKVGKSTEFGAKISISVIEGYSYVDRISWDNYNECHDLKGQIEKYKKRFGYYPEVVLCDQIYRTRENRAFCKELEIIVSGPPLGRKPKVKVKEKYKESERNPVEGKFGEAKRRYSLGLIVGKLHETSESIISMINLVMNAKRMMREIRLTFFALLLMLNEKVKNHRKYWLP